MSRDGWVTAGLLAGIVLVVGLLALNSHLAVQVGRLEAQAGAAVVGDATAMAPRLSRMSFTAFDRQKARELMDKDGDGRCDACGMAVTMCIDGGMMQCTMDPDATLGVLGSQHIHADWKVYVDGQAIDWTPYAMDMARMDSQLTSSFIHVDAGAPAPERAGDVIHMHATGIPLGLFFESIGMRLDKDCLALSADEEYCAAGANTLKFYVNGEPSGAYGAYVFADLDKLLISYGPRDEDVSGQLASITDFAALH